MKGMGKRQTYPWVLSRNYLLNIFLQGRESQDSPLRGRPGVCRDAVYRAPLFCFSLMKQSTPELS